MSTPPGWLRTQPISCWCSRICGTGITPITWPGCPCIELGCASSSWPACTPGRSPPPMPRRSTPFRALTRRSPAKYCIPPSSSDGASTAIGQRWRFPPRWRSMPSGSLNSRPKALAALTVRPMLLHGDIRADNMFFDGDSLKIVDFQFASRGAGAADVAYLISQGLPTEVRRGHDEQLVREYLARLADDGVVDYSFDEAWQHYRLRRRLSHAAPRHHPGRLGHDAGTLARTCA